MTAPGGRRPPGGTEGTGNFVQLTRRAIAPLVLAGLVAACSGGGDDDDRADREREEEDGGGTEQAGELGDDEAVEAAEAFLEDYDGLDDEGRDSLELVGTRRSPGVTHVRYRQVFDDVAVRSAQLVVHVDDDGEVLGASDSTTEARPEPGVEQQLDEAEATDVANKAVPDEVTETTAANVVWLPDGDGLRLGWSVAMATSDSSYTVWVDAVTGEVADARETRLEYDHELAARPVQAADDCDEQLEELDADGPVACIFAPDPVAVAGDVPDLDEADSFRTAVELRGLDDPDSGALVGEFVNLEAPQDAEEPVREEDGVWDQGAQEPGFEAVMAYFWIDTAQRLIQDLGFDDVRNESFPVVPRHEDEVANAFFSASLDLIVLGVGPDGGPDAGEDARVILHEYGHAVLHQQAPGLIFSDAAGAYHDGFADAFAGLIAMDLSDDPACLFPWFLGSFSGEACGRRLDTDKVFPDDLENEVHLDGEIWTGAIFDIFEGLLAEEGLDVADCAGSDDCDEVRDRVLTSIIAANEFLTGNEGLPEIAQAYLLANEAAFDDADRALIEDALAAHGLDGGGDGVVDGDGRPTGDAPAVEIAAEISHSFRGDLRIRLGVVDAEFDDLCTSITLLEPTPGDDADNVSGTVDVSDTDCAAFVPPSADQQWVLLVEDTAEQDVGQVNGFAVIVEGTPFLATGVPAPIADADPSGTAVIVNASGSRVPQEGEQAPGETGAGVPFVSLEIAHTFVGDLQIRAGAASATDGSVLCSVPVLEPDPQDDGDDASGEVDMSACAEFFPPSGDIVWFLEVVDGAAADEGTIERFEVFGPDGVLVGAAVDVPIPIPDDDPGGAVALVAG